jgi:hypothetical protein
MKVEDRLAAKNDLMAFLYQDEGEKDILLQLQVRVT